MMRIKIGVSISPIGACLSLRAVTSSRAQKGDFLLLGDGHQDARFSKVLPADCS